MPEREQYVLPLLAGSPSLLPAGRGNGKKNGRAPKPCRISQLPPLHVGVDEAGRGCLAGPVVAGAVLFPENFNFPEQLPGLDDSKKLDEKKRLLLKPVIEKSAVAFGIGVSWQDEIDAVNILNATFRAMSRAILALVARLEQTSLASLPLPKLFIDGNKTIPTAQWYACQGPDSSRFRGAQSQPRLPFISASMEKSTFFSPDAPHHSLGKETADDHNSPSRPDAGRTWEARLALPRGLLPVHSPRLPEQEAVVSGDALLPSISAASILAKTARDALMPALDTFCPGYDFSRHKGYGTRFHCERIAELGPSILHRKSFKYPNRT